MLQARPQNTNTINRNANALQRYATPDKLYNLLQVVN